MKILNKQLLALVTALTLVGTFSKQANAVLILDVTTSDATTIAFNVSGDFSGYSVPASLTDFLHFVPIDNAGNPMTTWYNGSIAAGPRPNAEINGNFIVGWVIQSETRTDDFGFGPAGDSISVQFLFGPYDDTAVLTTDLSINWNFALNPAGVDHFNLYWGKTTLVAQSSSMSVPEPSLFSLFVLAIVGAGFARKSRTH